MTRFPRTALIALAAAGSLTLGACSSSEHAADSCAPTSGAAASSASSASSASGTVKVTDNYGEKTVASPPQRVVALDNRTFEVRDAGGVEPVAAARSLVPNLEAIVAADPDVIVSGQRFQQYDQEIEKLVPNATLLDFKPRDGVAFDQELIRQTTELGAAGLTNARTLEMFVLQLVLMVGLSPLLYMWLLTGNNPGMHAMLLVGIVLGVGLGSVSTFMQRMLTPSEFDVLTARLFGSVNNADPAYFPTAVPLELVATALLLLNSRRLNVLALGRDAAVNLGVNHKANAIYTLVLVAVLTAVSTALVGPMTFLGFLVVTLVYQVADTTGTSSRRR